MEKVFDYEESVSWLEQLAQEASKDAKEAAAYWEAKEALILEAVVGIEEIVDILGTDVFIELLVLEPGEDDISESFSVSVKIDVVGEISEEVLEKITSSTKFYEMEEGVVGRGYYSRVY